MIDFSTVKSIVIPEGEVSVIARGAEILWQKQISRLPAEYQEVAYLESNYTQYIDTGYVPNLYSKMTLDFEPTEKQSACYAGSRYNSGKKTFAILSGNGSTTQYGAMGDMANKSLGRFTQERQTITICKDEFIRNGVVTPVSVTSFDSEYSVYLFACNTRNSAVLDSACRIYSCQIWDNDILVRDYVPCYRKSDNKPGMYDLVTETLLTNDGTGEFLYG